MRAVTVATLDLDLDVFSGPFDLLLTLILREEIDLLELSLADVVLAYLDHLEARGELDLETATEFIVLIAALLELKSKLMLTARTTRSCWTSSPSRPPMSCSRGCSTRAATARPRAHLRELLAREHGVRFRAAPLPAAAAPHDRRARRRLGGPARARRGDRAAAAHAAARSACATSASRA